MYRCATCRVTSCRTEGDKYPRECPSLEEDLLAKIKTQYNNEEDRKIAYTAALVEKEGYGRLTRVEETILYFKKLGLDHLGLAFCGGLMEEGRTLYEILSHHGFKVDSVMCKAGSIGKDFMGIEKKDFLRPETKEIMCNPIGQAEFLNERKSQYNILLGLCVGHDSLFLKHSQAPVTVIGVKDRVLCNNPIGILYQEDKYYKGKLFPDK